MGHTKDQVQSRSPRIAAWRWSAVLGWRALRLLLSLVGVALVTFMGYAVFPVNATTVGFGYLLLVLIIASIWGFVDAALASIAATLTFNFFFFAASRQIHDR